MKKNKPTFSPDEFLQASRRLAERIRKADTVDDREIDDSFRLVMGQVKETVAFEVAPALLVGCFCSGRCRTTVCCNLVGCRYCHPLRIRHRFIERYNDNK